MIAGLLEGDAPLIDECLHGGMIARELFEGALMVNVGPAIAQVGDQRLPVPDESADHCSTHPLKEGMLEAFLVELSTQHPQCFAQPLASHRLGQITNTA